MTTYIAPTSLFITAADSVAISSFIFAAKVALQSGKMTLRAVQDKGMELQLTDRRLQRLVSVCVRSKAMTYKMFEAAVNELAALCLGSIDAETEAAEFNARQVARTAVTNNLDAMVDILRRSEGTGRGMVAEFPALMVLRIDAEVMVISRDVARVLTFVTPRATQRHGVLFDSFQLSGVGAYAAEYGDNEAERIARAKANGEDLFWLGKQGACITSGATVQELALQILPGQRIMFDGVLLEVRAAGTNLKLDEVK